MKNIILNYQTYSNKVKNIMIYKLSIKRFENVCDFKELVTKICCIFFIFYNLYKMNKCIRKPRITFSMLITSENVISINKKLRTV